MPYVVHNFESGDILYAESLNEMDAQIALNEQNIDAGVSSDMLAEEYSANKTYSVGDYVIYNNELYVCIYEITAPEGWNSAHWQVANLGDGISDVKNALNVYTASGYFRSLFEFKGLNATVGNKIQYIDSTTRMSITRLLKAVHDIVLTVDPSCYVAVQTCDENDVYTSDSGWKTSYTILAGTYFHLSFRTHSGGTVVSSDLEALSVTEQDFSVAPYTEQYSENRLQTVNNELLSAMDNINGELYPYQSDGFFKQFFERKGVNAVVGQKFAYVSSTTRLSITKLLYAKDNIALHVETGYRYAIQTADSNDIFIADSGWKTADSTVSIGTYFHLTMSKTSNTEIILDDLDNLTISVDGFNSTKYAYLFMDSASIAEEFVYVNQDRNENFKSIAHRGFSSDAPENTLPAFVLARKKGYKYCENDVRFTSDNVPVLLHDPTINRTARNADGTTISQTVYISDITYAQAQEYDFGIWKGATFAGTKIMTLEEFVAFCKNAGMHGYIEMRNDVVYTAQQYEIVVDLVKKYGMLRNVTWISHGVEKLNAILALDPSARVGLIADTLTQSTVTDATGLQTSSNRVFIDADYSTLTDENLQYAINVGIPVEVWTVDSEITLLALNSYISGITTNGLRAWEILLHSYM